MAARALAKQVLNDRVDVPRQLYKEVYLPVAMRHRCTSSRTGQAPQYKVISIAELEQLAGIDFFPTMSTLQRAESPELPAPNPFN
jgi:endonuclease G